LGFFQQRAEPRPGAFGIGPADNDKFLAVKAFDLNSQAAVAGRIRRIGALGDDALQRHRAGFFIERAALSFLMIGVVQREPDLLGESG
jgi:hypothetical protein